MKVSLPNEPWDHNPKAAQPSQEHYRKLVGKAFDGHVGPRDILYMAKALLQLNDEMHELRERIVVLEKARQFRG